MTSRAGSGSRSSISTPPPADNVAAYLAWKKAGGDNADASSRPSGTLRIQRISEIAPKRIRWLWEGRLPRGKVVVLDGDPGTGKSTIMLDLAARISKGARWPDGARGRRGAVMICSAEDSAADTIRPRLDIAGADVDQVHIVHDHFSLPAHIPLLEAEIKARRIALVIIDVLMAYLSTDINSYRDQDVRRVLTPLEDMAERTGACIVVIRHLNKATGQSAIYRGGGSIGIAGAARGVLLSAPVNGGKDGFVLAWVKLTNDKLPKSLAYRIVSNGEGQPGRIEWAGESSHTAEDLLSDSHDKQSPYLSAATVWLDAKMQECGGEVKSSDALREGMAQGFSKRVLYEAKDALGIESYKEPGRFDAPWVWIYESCGVSQHPEDPGSQVSRDLRDVGMTTTTPGKTDQR